MNKNHLVLLMLSFPIAALADTPVVRVPAPVFFDKQPNSETPSKDFIDDKPAEQRLSDDLSYFRGHSPRYQLDTIGNIFLFDRISLDVAQ